VYFAATDTRPGSKASSPSETPTKAQIDFQFLNFTHPSDAKASGTRKAVRSHVTKQQHQKEHAAAAARRAKTFPRADNEMDEAMIPSRSATPSTRPMTLELPRRDSPAIMRISSTTASSPSAVPSGSVSPAPLQGSLDVNDVYPQEWHPYLPRIMVSLSSV